MIGAAKDFSSLKVDGGVQPFWPSIEIGARTLTVGGGPDRAVEAKS